MSTLKFKDYPLEEHNTSFSILHFQSEIEQQRYLQNYLKTPELFTKILFFTPTKHFRINASTSLLGPEHYPWVMSWFYNHFWRKQQIAGGIQWENLRFDGQNIKIHKLASIYPFLSRGASHLDLEILNCPFKIDHLPIHLKVSSF